MTEEVLRVAIVQIAPVFLNSKKTWEKMREYMQEAVESGAELIVWGETLIPGYLSWVDPTNGSRFNDRDQKTAYATYLEEALTLDGNDEIIQQMCSFAKKNGVMLMGGIAEREGTSVYCTLLTIGAQGQILGRHRKLKPTYEERLIWSDGDGRGLKLYETKIGLVGGLNCYENWIPHARGYLHDLGEVIHISVWPGRLGLTKDNSRFSALEGRSWIVAASGLLRPNDYEAVDEKRFPFKDIMMETESPYNGGSMIVAPTGEIVAGPLVDEEGIVYADLDRKTVYQERHNFDYSGHYSRKNILTTNKWEEQEKTT